MKAAVWPDTWLSVDIEEIVQPDYPVCYGVLKPGEWDRGGVPLVRVTDIRSNNYDVSRMARISLALDREFSRSRIKAGDVLISVQGTVGKVAVVPAGVAHANISRTIARIRPVAIIPSEWIQKALLSTQTQDLIRNNIGGTTRDSLNIGDLRQFSLPLPPLAEQKRIVVKLDALSAKSARARTELARIETLVSRYKQAVLGKAFSGELVGLIPDATEKPHALCWDLPLGWRWVAFEEAVEIASNLVNPNTIPELPHIAPDNIESGTARLLQFRTIAEDGVISAKHRFFAGQILYSKIRPYLRKVVIADFDGACSADMYPLSPRDVLSAPYLLHWLVSEQFTRFAVEHQGRTVLPKINQTALNKTPLPLPPLATQHEIILRVESAFARIDRLAKEAKRALDLVGRLDEAILAKAFRGELVPQDENDEPAEHLLARIRAEREAAPKVKKRAVKRTSAMLTARDFLNAKLSNWPNDGISFQDLRSEFGGSYEDLKDAVFALLSDKNAPLQQAFDERQSTMTLRRLEQ